MFFIFGFLIVFIGREFNESILRPNSIPITIQNNESCDDQIFSYNCTTKLHNSTYEYSFLGEKFEIFGIFPFLYGEFNIYLDEQKISTISNNNQNENGCTLHYSSEIVQYCEHKVIITCISFKICKFSFWPSIEAIRINASDLISHQKKIINSNFNINCINEKVALIKCSKIWIYGSITNQSKFDVISFSIDNDRFSINRKSDLYISNDGSFLYEIKNLDFKRHEIIFHTNGLANLYCIYYISTMNKIKDNRIEFSEKTKIDSKPFSFTHYSAKSHYSSSLEISQPVMKSMTNSVTDMMPSKSGNSIFNELIERKSEIHKSKIIILIFAFEIFIFFILLVIEIILLIHRIIGPIEESNDIPLIVL